MKNRQGLPRNIPADVKQNVRIACGFGCVICGSIPYDYDHVSTEYRHADVHDPDDIVLLCPTHHRMKGKLLSVADIKTARRRRQGVDSTFRFKLPATSRDFAVKFAGNYFSSNDSSIVVDNTPILTFVTTDNELEPLLISGQFRDRFGQVICEIVDNAFIGRADWHGDFTLESNRFRYILPNGKMGLSFKLEKGLIDMIFAFHAMKDSYVYLEDDLFQIGNVLQSYRFLNSQFLDSETQIKIGTCLDNFIFDRVDIIQYSTVTYDRCTIKGATNGIYIEGVPRYIITSNYDR